MSKRIIGSFLASLIFVAAAALVVLNVQRIHDTVQYYQFTPDEMMAAFAEDTGMNDHGKFLFYASHPRLSDATTFTDQCGEPEQAATILGCYDGVNIYIFDVTDERLKGIRPTTAAHEMLHAAYKRLSPKEKARIDALLIEEFERQKTNEELAGKIAFYEKSQPGAHTNELHSIIGTEVANISKELEEYYGRYFVDRSKVVAQHAQYRSVFEELKTKANILREQMDVLGREIEDQKATIAQRSSLLQARVDSFNGRADRGEFDSQAAFLSERQSLLNEIAALESLSKTIEDAVTRYNQLVAELNGIATETNSLNRSLNSNVTPVPKL